MTSMQQFFTDCGKSYMPRATKNYDLVVLTNRLFCLVTMKSRGRVWNRLVCICTLVFAIAVKKM